MESIDVTFVKLVADLGYSIMSGGLMLLIAYKFFNSMMRQNKSISDSIVPTMESIKDQLSEVKDTLNEHITAHNTSANIKLNDIENKLDQILELEKARNTRLEQIIQIVMVIYTITVKNSKENILDGNDIINNKDDLNQ